LSNQDAITHHNFVKALQSRVNWERLLNSFVVGFCDPSNNYYIEATSKDECNYLLLFNVANGGFCDDLYDEILESDEPVESIEDLNNEIDKLFEKGILCNLSVINFVKINR